MATMTGKPGSRWERRPRRDGQVTKNDQHGVFVAGLGERLLVRYSDGGPGGAQKPRIKRRSYGDPASRLPKRGKVGAGGRFARSIRRRTPK